MTSAVIFQGEGGDLGPDGPIGPRGPQVSLTFKTINQTNAYIM